METSPTSPSPAASGQSVSRFYLRPGSASHSEQRQRPLRNAVVLDAQALYRAKGGKSIELTIAFDPARPVTSLRSRRLPSELAALAKRIDNSPASGEVDRRQFRAVPEIAFVHLNTREYPDATWRIIGSYGVELMSRAGLESIVRDKEALSSQYHGHDAYWLLVIVDPMDAAQEQEIRIDDHNVTSQVFERIIVYKPGFEHIVEAKS
jgi:hypothetical protein